MLSRLEADQRAERCGDQRQRDHRRHQPRADAELEIITRFKVPTISAVAMPTTTWNSDSRSSRDSGSSADGCIGKRQPARGDALPVETGHQAAAGDEETHARFNSNACEV